jgi:hypothetical protein
LIISAIVSGMIVKENKEEEVKEKTRFPFF